MPLKLLVIDHDKASARLMKEVFEPKGAEVQIAKDAETAARLINHEKFDGIFLEMEFPEGDAVEFIRRIRTSGRNARTIIVLVAKSSSARAVQRGFAAGATLYLPKPLERNLLMTTFSSTRGIMVEERRRQGRIPLSITARCLVGGRTIEDCVIRNLSLTGALVQGDGTIRVHDKVRLAFSFEKGDRIVTATGVTVRVDKSEQAGFRLVWDTSEDRQRVRTRIATVVDNL